MEQKFEGSEIESFCGKEVRIFEEVVFGVGLKLEWVGIFYVFDYDLLGIKDEKLEDQVIGYNFL